jgi:hypothetical protein
MPRESPQGGPVFAGVCQIHDRPLPCHFASFDFVLRSRHGVQIGSAEYQPDQDVVLIDAVGERENARRFSVEAQGRFEIGAAHLPGADEIRIVRLPVLGSLVFKDQPVKVGDRIRISELDAHSIVFDLVNVAEVPHR